MFKETYGCPIGLFHINCALPYRGCQCYVCNKSEIPLAILHIFPGKSEKTKKSGFWMPVWILSGNLCENKDFCPKTWKSRTTSYQKMSENSTSSIGGGPDLCVWGCVCMWVGALVFTDDRGLWVHACVVKKQTLPTMDVHSCRTSAEGAI